MPRTAGCATVDQSHRQHTISSPHKICSLEYMTISNHLFHYPIIQSETRALWFPLTGLQVWQRDVNGGIHFQT